MYDEIAPYIINECNLENKLKQYKSVLDEIREYIKEQLKFCENDSQGAYEICNLTISKYKHLLQILDKVKE